MEHEFFLDRLLIEILLDFVSTIAFVKHGNPKVLFLNQLYENWKINFQ